MADEDTSQAPAPLVVEYCTVCSFPLEYCEFGPSPEECRAKNGSLIIGSSAKAVADVAAKVATLDVSEPATTASSAEASSAVVGSDADAPVAEDAGDNNAEEGAEAGDDSKKKKRPKKKVVAVLQPKGVVITVTSRGKRKFVTSIVGLASYGLDLKQAQKALSARFAASAAVIGDDEIQIQGDQSLDLEEFLPTKYPKITADQIKIKVVAEKSE